MIQKRTLTNQAVPSALLHNGAETRRQLTRAFFKGMTQRFSRKAQTVQAQAEAAIDIPRMQGSV